MPAQPRTAEQKVARIAGLAHGVVTRVGLLAAGISRDEIAHRLAPSRRYTWTDVFEEPEPMLAELLGLLPNQRC